MAEKEKLIWSVGAGDPVEIDVDELEAHSGKKAGEALSDLAKGLLRDAEVSKMAADPTTTTWLSTGASGSEEKPIYHNTDFADVIRAIRESTETPELSMARPHSGGTR